MESGQDRVPHLVIVDDEPVILQILRNVFEDEPYRLTCVNNGTDAVRVMEQQGCDLLLTDKNLPDVNGMELLRIAKSLDPNTEVIIITGYASLETALTALELDAFDYVLKPLDNIFEIRNKARQALEKRHITKENRRLMGDLQCQNQALTDALDKSRRLQSELIQSEKLAGIGTLAAGIAHEISSPLFGIMGLAEAITDEEDLSEAQKYASEIVRYCRSIREIMHDLSSYSRSGGRADDAVVDLASSADDAIRLISRGQSLEGVRVINQIPEGLTVLARPNEVQQVFLNLVKNGIHAVQEISNDETDGEIRLTGGRDDADHWVEIRDQGPGIPEDKLNQLYDPFFTTKPPGSGTGLGLNIVYRILTRYRGTIAAGNAEDGRGAVFRLQIPAHLKE
jgi:C4-dicarboxylate-specific signal transduction histidine kinase